MTNKLQQHTTSTGKLVAKLAVTVVGMFGFGYGLVPLYKAICAATGINVLALNEVQNSGRTVPDVRNTQVDMTRTITVEFDDGQVLTFP